MNETALIIKIKVTNGTMLKAAAAMLIVERVINKDTTIKKQEEEASTMIGMATTATHGIMRNMTRCTTTMTITWAGERVNAKG